MRIIGIVILYYPNEALLVERIEKYIGPLTKLIIYNNTPNVKNGQYELLFNNKYYKYKLQFVGGNGNKGLREPINMAIQTTIAEEYDYLLTMDQDSKWENFDTFIKYVQERTTHNDIIIPYIPNLYGMNWYDYNTEQYLHFFINSGTLYSRTALEQIGLMNELFFVEGIDTDYCIRANSKGILVKMCKNAILNQSLDDEIQIGHFLWKKGIKSKYSAKRLYGLAFSITYMLKKYPNPWHSYLLDQRKSLFGWNLIKNILMYGDNRISRIGAYLKGVYDASTIDY